MHDVDNVSDFDKFKLVDFCCQVQARAELNKGHFVSYISGLCRSVVLCLVTFNKFAVDDGINGGLDRIVKSLGTLSEQERALKVFFDVCRRLF